MSSYDLPSYDPRDLDRDFPYFAYPKIVGGLSLDQNKEFVHDRSQLMILKPENEILAKGKSFDLNIGYDENKTHRIRKVYEQDEYMNYVLRWILANRHRYDESKSQIFGADFLTFRGNFRNIMLTPYEKEGWVLRIQKWKDTIFIAKKKTPENFNDVKSEERKRSSYYGYKFETLLTTTANNSCQNAPEDEPVCEKSAFIGMFVSQIGNFRVQYGAELDGYMDPNAAKDNTIPLQADKFVKIHTSNAIRHPGQERFLRKVKFLHWWANCFLVGTRDVIVGWKDSDGVVRHVQKIPVQECARSALGWKDNVCFNFLLDVLTFLKETIVENSVTKVYRLSWDPDSGLNMEIEAGTEPFLHEWFHSQFKQ